MPRNSTQARIEILFLGSGMRATFLRAAFGSAGLQIVNLVLSFLVGIQLSRGLGVAGYGVYAFALSIATLLGIPTEFGLSQVAVREASAASAKGDWARFQGIARFSTRIVAISSVGIALAGEMVLHFTALGADPTRRAALEFGLLLIPLVAQTKLCGALLMGLGQILKGQLANLVLRPGLFAVLLAIAVLQWQVLRPATAMGLQVVGTAIALVVSATLLLTAIPSEARGVPPRYETRVWLLAALPMAMTDGMRVLQGHLSVFLIGALSTPEQIGLYRVADSTAAMIGFPASMFNIMVVPLFARLWALKDVANIQKISAAVTVGMLAGVTLLSIPIWVSGRFLLGYVFGSSFAPAYVTLLIASASNFVFAFFGPSSTLMNMTGGERSVARAFGISVVANFAVGLCTIPTLGSPGAALGSITGAIVWNWTLWREAKRNLGVDTSLLAVPRASRSWLT